MSVLLYFKNPYLVRPPPPPPPPPPAPKPTLRGYTSSKFIKVNVIWVHHFIVTSSQERRQKTHEATFYGKANELLDYITNINNEYTDAFNTDIQTIDNEIQSVRKLKQNPKAKDLTRNKMRAEEPIAITNLFGSVIPITITDENCVKSTLRQLYPLISNLKKDPIGSLGDELGVSIHEIREFCSQYSIRMSAYDIEGKLITTYNPPKQNSKYKSLTFVYYDNHMYPVKNTQLRKNPPPAHHECLPEADLEAKFYSVLNENILPADIRVGNDHITQFSHNGITYFTNPEYQICYDILSQYNLQDHITPSTTLTNLLNMLEKLFEQPKTLSFFPIPTKKPVFLYTTTIDTSRPHITIDKNGCFPDLLKDLPHLLVCDWRNTPVEVNPSSQILSKYFYIATPEFSSQLMPGTDIYCGDHLRFCRDVAKIPFTIRERIECLVEKNHFSQIVTDIRKRFPKDTAKSILNKLIGIFQCETEVKTSYDGILVSEDDVDERYDHFRYNDKYIEKRPHRYVAHIMNRKPIAIQIKDALSRMVYSQLYKQGVYASEVAQISTDAITFYTDKINFKVPSGWKVQPFKPCLKRTYNTYEGTTTLFLHDDVPNENTYYDGYAGNGKSTHAKNRQDLQNYIVLASKHSALTQHRAEGLHCEVIQKYGFNHTIPDEHHIIPEEIGVFSGQDWNILIKCKLLGKKISAYGDFHQLTPFGEKRRFNAPQFLSWMFSTISKELDKNYRNDFPISYYETLLSSKDPEYLWGEIQKHSTKTPEEAEVIIGVRNKTIDHYNDLMLKHKQDTNVPMMCKDNDLRHKDIFNNYLMMSQDIDPEDIKHFKPAYARTLYNMQGDECRSFYACPEDKYFVSKPHEAYTLISRLRV